MADGALVSSYFYTAGHTKRATVIGLFFIVYAGGNIAGPHMFLPREAPRYFSAIQGLLGTYCALILLQVVYTAWAYYVNRSRDRQRLYAERQEEEESLEDFEDLTDKLNIHFRYKV